MKEKSVGASKIWNVIDLWQIYDEIPRQIQIISKKETKKKLISSIISE